jgi:hypothetical protein
MAQFDHPNILSLVGVCTRPPGEPTLIVLEYMHLGALHGYLQSPLVRCVPEPEACKPRVVSCFSDILLTTRVMFTAQ